MDDRPTQESFLRDVDKHAVKVIRDDGLYRMNAIDFQHLLEKLNACTEARDWARGKSLVEVWQQCERGDWLLWLCARMAGEVGWPTRNDVTLAACDCAETALRYVKPGEDRPRLAIECARRLVAGLATREEAYAAADAADAVYAAYAAAYYAAYAAADAVYAVDYAAYAANAKKKALKQCADLVRKRLPMPLAEEEGTSV